jgi:acyl carrier protein
MKRKKIKIKVKDIITDITDEEIDDIKGSTFLDEIDLDLDNKDFKDLRDKINNEFGLALKKKELKDCLDINAIVDLIEDELDDETPVNPPPSKYVNPKSNIIKDIVNDYKNNTKEIYYKKDLIGGLMLIVEIIGLGKMALAIGGAAAGAIGSILSYAANHPQAATQCAAMISKYSDQIGELITSAGKKFDEKYNNLSKDDKKKLRTLILFIAKKGVSWADLY